MAKRNKKTKAPGEGLGLTGNETAAELYNMYMKARQGNDQKTTDAYRSAWQTQYHKEKGSKVQQA